MNKQEIAAQIRVDILNGTYDNFPKLKARLDHIQQKIVESIYIQNRDLTEGEIKTLIENDYINEFDNLFNF